MWFALFARHFYDMLMWHRRTWSLDQRNFCFHSQICCKQNYCCNIVCMNSWFVNSDEVKLILTNYRTFVEHRQYVRHLVKWRSPNNGFVQEKPCSQKIFYDTTKPSKSTRYWLLIVSSNTSNWLMPWKYHPKLHNHGITWVGLQFFSKSWN